MTRTQTVPRAPAYTGAMPRPKARRTKFPKVDSRGSVRLPPPVMTSAGLKPGDLVSFEVVDDGVLVRKSLLVEIEGGFVVHGGVPGEDLVEAMKRMKQEDLDHEIERCWRS